MKVFLADLKKAKVKNRIVAEGGAPPLKKAITKRPRVALGGPSTLAKAPASHLPSAPIIEEDDNKVEVILALILAIPISSSTLTSPVATPRKLSTSI